MTQMVEQQGHVMRFGMRWGCWHVEFNRYNFIKWSFHKIVKMCWKIKICFSQQLNLFIIDLVDESSPVFSAGPAYRREIQRWIDAIFVWASTSCAFIGLFIPVSCTLNLKQIIQGTICLSVCGTWMKTWISLFILQESICLIIHSIKVHNKKYLLMFCHFWYQK